MMDCSRLLEPILDVTHPLFTISPISVGKVSFMALYKEGLSQNSFCIFCSAQLMPLHHPRKDSFAIRDHVPDL